MEFTNMEKYQLSVTLYSLSSGQGSTRNSRSLVSTLHCTTIWQHCYNNNSIIFTLHFVPSHIHVQLKKCLAVTSKWYGIFLFSSKVVWTCNCQHINNYGLGQQFWLWIQSIIQYKLLFTSKQEYLLLLLHH